MQILCFVGLSLKDDENSVFGHTARSTLCREIYRVELDELVVEKEKLRLRYLYNFKCLLLSSVIHSILKDSLTSHSRSYQLPVLMTCR